jgi:hypothetical protein
MGHRHWYRYLPGRTYCEDPDSLVRLLRLLYHYTDASPYSRLRRLQRRLLNAKSFEFRGFLFMYPITF